MLPGPSPADFERARERMIRVHLRGRGIKDERVLDAFRRVPREEFVWEIDRGEAYADHPVRIGEAQTISQPYMVALMTQQLALGGDERVLEIGTGSGYQTAILAELAREVFTIERFESLSESAKERLGRLSDRLGPWNIHYRVGDGTLGWPADIPGAGVQDRGAPFDAIIVTAGAPDVPEPLKRQLAPGGRLVIPVGPAREQGLLVITKVAAKSGPRRCPHRAGEGKEGGFKTNSVCPCIFVKLVGEEGWSES